MFLMSLYYRIFSVIRRSIFLKKNFALSPLNCFRFGVRLIAKYFYARKFKNVIFSNFNLVENKINRYKAEDIVY